MFSWNKDLSRLEIPAGRVLKLMQSMSDIQVVLPGMTGQMATAYLCAYAGSKGVRVAVALHLQESHRLAFYVNDQGEVPREKLGALLKEGVRFAESMGFLLDELDLQTLDEGARKARWEALPLSRGVSPPPRMRQAPPAKPASSRPVAAENPPPQAPEVVETPPTPAEMAARRARLLENLGRFLASL